MRFIELTGKRLMMVVNEGELSTSDLRAAGIENDTIVRVNEHGDVEVRREDHWDVIGGLLGDYAERLRKTTGLTWA